MQTIEIPLGSTIQRFSIFVIFLTTLLSSSPVYSQQRSITYIANEGVLIEKGDQKVLIDALFDEFYEAYLSPTEATREMMISGEIPYDQVNAVLTTHIHRDHFEPTIAGDFLKEHLESKFLSTAQAGNSLKEYEHYEQLANRIITHEKGTFTLTDEVNGIKVYSFFTEHSPGIENMGFVFEIGGSSILHLGDSNIDLERFKQLNLKQYNIDVALVPYWYMSDEVGQKIINEEIKAEQLVGIHFPKAPSSMVLKTIEVNYPEATVFKTPGERVGF